MNGILIIFLSLIFASFFSGMDLAFNFANKFRIELDRKHGVFGSELVKIFIDHPGQYSATMLTGNIIAVVVYCISFMNGFSPVLSRFTESDVLVLIISIVISTGLILFATEFLPKAVFLISPNFFLKMFSLPALFFYYMFYPITRATIGLSNLFTGIFSGVQSFDNEHENIVFSKVDIDQFVNHFKQNTDESEPDRQNIKIFRNALDFSNVKLRECMVPRTEIDAIESSSSIEKLKESFVETGHSRILVYQDSIDNIIGYFELKDIFKNPPDIVSCIRKVAIVPETMAANKLLKIFIDEKKNVALVVDEFGGTSGMVTIEDILEEIVGDIVDEHDTYELTEKVINENEYVLSGRLEIDYLNEKYNLGLPEKDDYETLAGLILYSCGSIPVNNEVIRIGKFIFRILRVSSTRLELVNLKIE